MENLTYSNIRKTKPSISYPFELEKEELSLLDILEKENWDTGEIEGALHNDLRNALNQTDLPSLINTLIDIEHSLEKVQEKFPGRESIDLSNLYNCLSPLLLRAVKDSLDAGESAESTLNSIKEAIRICLEEELYR